MMQRLSQYPILRRLDSGLLITLLLCAFSLWPLLYRPGLPNGDDVLYHVYRAAEMDRAWSHGVLMPQWAESFYTGYGAPLFHYYASLTYYVTSIFTRLFHTDAVNSLRLLIALSMFGAGAGMYGFARRFSGKVGGVIAALCYVYSPYILFTEPYSRGAYPEMLAFALFPALMWSYAALIERHHSARVRTGLFALAAVLEAALIITHNLMALVLTGLLVAWLLWQIVSQQPSAFSRQPSAVSQRSTVGRLVSALSTQHSALFFALLAVALGIGLAAYFWLPVTLEGAAVKLANLTGTAELNYRNFFVPSLHLLEANPRPDAGAFNGLEHRLNLGVAQWVLGLIGAAGIALMYFKNHVSLLGINYRITSSTGETKTNTDDFFVGTRYIVSLLFFALAALALIFLIVSASASIWQTIAPLAFLQFPWRLLGPAVFCLSVLAGMNALWLERLPRWIGASLTAGIVVLIIALAAPTLYVTEWIHETVDTSVGAYQQAEVQGLQRATTFSNEYLPATVAVEPGATPRLLADYADGYPVNKAHMEVLPPGVTVEVLDHEPQLDVWKVNAPAAFTMEALTYDFPGWAAEIDGQTVPITPSDPHGLITFPVPQGSHTVRLYLGSTPPRDLGNVITLISAVMLVGVVGFSSRLVFTPAGDAAVKTQHSALSTHYLLFGGLIAFAFLLVYMREGGAWVDSPPGQVILTQHPMDVHLGDQIHLLGYDLNADTFRPGDRVELTAYWYTTGAIPYGYSSFVHISTGGPPLAQADKLNPAGLPTKIWPSTGYIHDDYAIDLPPDMPPGEYEVFIGLYTCDMLPAGQCGNGDRLEVIDADGKAIGDEVLLAKIAVKR